MIKLIADNGLIQGKRDVTLLSVKPTFTPKEVLDIVIKNAPKVVGVPDGFEMLCNYVASLKFVGADNSELLVRKYFGFIKCYRDVKTEADYLHFQYLSSIMSFFLSICYRRKHTSISKDEAEVMFLNGVADAMELSLCDLLRETDYKEHAVYSAFLEILIFQEQFENRTN